MVSVLSVYMPFNSLIHCQGNKAGVLSHLVIYKVVFSYNLSQDGGIPGQRLAFRQTQPSAFRGMWLLFYLGHSSTIFCQKSPFCLAAIYHSL